MHQPGNFTCGPLIEATIGGWSQQWFRSLTAGLQVTQASSTIAATATATSDASSAGQKTVRPVLDITKYLGPIDHWNLNAAIAIPGQNAAPMTIDLPPVGMGHLQLFHATAARSNLCSQ